MAALPQTRRNLTNPVFHDEEKARKFLEDERWPDGPVCPFCGGLDDVRHLGGKSMGPGWYFCNACDKRKFTVRTGSIMERALPNRTFQKHSGRGVCVPNGMSVVELVEVAQELEREFEIDGTTAKLMAESALNVINRLRAEN